MSTTLISRSSDLRHLRDNGYAVSVVEGYLLISEIPYVTSRREIAHGVLVSELSLAGQLTATPGDHVVRFIGEMPCHSDGTPLHELVIDSQPVQLNSALSTNHTFSHKPTGGYPDYFAKMTAYIRILVSRAQAIDPSSTAQNFTPIPGDEDSPFIYLDTASSRSGTTSAAAKLAGETVAIVGLGGTGSYVLDYLAKTPVNEIHLFDADDFLQHNAFRSPGAATLADLRARRTKVHHFAGRYAQMKQGIVEHPVLLDEATIELLASATFVFLCIDDGPAKRVIIDYCEAHTIPFIDVGIGVAVVNGALSGIVRTTVSRCNPEDRAAARTRISFGQFNDDAAYHHGVQIAELNAFNAALAVIAYKKVLGFYTDAAPTYSIAYTIDTNDLVNDEIRV